MIAAFRTPFREGCSLNQVNDFHLSLYRWRHVTWSKFKAQSQGLLLANLSLCFFFFFLLNWKPDASQTRLEWFQIDSLINLNNTTVESAESKFLLCIAEFLPSSLSFRQGTGYVWAPWDMGVFQTCLYWDIWDSDKFPVRKRGKDMAWSVQTQWLTHPVEKTGLF